ncbi:MAG: ankyrin repeat domain-containing protein, partial [Pseudomonadota bacterium]
MEILATQLADLFSAVQCSDEKQIRRLLAANVSPIQRNRQGTTALMAATKIGNSKIIQMLHGALRDKRPSAQLFFSQIVSTFSTAVSPTAALTSFMAAAPADSEAISPVPLGAIARPNEAPTLSILPVLPTDLARSNEVSVLPYEKQRTYPADAVAVVVCNSAVCNSASAAPLVLWEDAELPASEALALELPAPQLSALSQSTRLSSDQQSEQLKTAVCKNDWGAVKDLLSAGVRVQSKNWYDMPVLVLAAQNASNDIVMALIQAGASVNSGYDRLPLNVASERGDFEVVHTLM